MKRITCALGVALVAVFLLGIDTFADNSGPSNCHSVVVDAACVARIAHCPLHDSDGNCFASDDAAFPTNCIKFDFMREQRYAVTVYENWPPPDDPAQFDNTRFIDGWLPRSDQFHPILTLDDHTAKFDFNEGGIGVIGNGQFVDQSFCAGNETSSR